MMLPPFGLEWSQLQKVSLYGSHTNRYYLGAVFSFLFYSFKPSLKQHKGTFIIFNLVGNAIG